MAADPRAALAAQQAALVRALAAGGAIPAGFDAARVRLSASTLVSKRLRAVARVCPALPRVLGRRFGARFTAYAARQPLPRTGAPADACAFLRDLARTGELDGALRGELVRLRLRRSRPVVLEVLRSGLLVGVRLPGGRARHAVIPVPLGRPARDRALADRSRAP